MLPCAGSGYSSWDILYRGIALFFIKVKLLKTNLKTTVNKNILKKKDA